MSEQAQCSEDLIEDVFMELFVAVVDEDDGEGLDVEGLLVGLLSIVALCLVLLVLFGLEGIRLILKVMRQAQVPILLNTDV